jgi:hypothetical protein
MSLLGPISPYSLTPSHKFNEKGLLERLSLAEYRHYQQYPRMFSPLSAMAHTHSSLHEGPPTMSSIGTTSSGRYDPLTSWCNGSKAEIDILDRLPKIDLPDMTIPNKVIIS